MGIPSQTLDATAFEPARCRCDEFATFAELQRVLERAIAMRPDVVIHSAAVSDYHVAEVVIPEHADERWLRLAPNPKLIDLVRSSWHFAGILVKFKLESRMDATELTSIAEAARTHSAADLIVANTLAGLTLLGPVAGNYERVRRKQLATRLLDAVEALAKERA